MACLWSREKSIRLCKEYRRRRDLWDSNHELYRVFTSKYESWNDLAAIFKCEVGDLRKKMNSLLASHRRERARVSRGETTTWFLYPYMKFLRKTEKEDDEEMEASEVEMDEQGETETNLGESTGMEYLDDSETHDDNLTEYILEEPTADDIIIKEEPRTIIYNEPATKKIKTKHALRRNVGTLRRIVKKQMNIDKADHNSSLENKILNAIKDGIKRTDSPRRKDECDSFGEYIASSLRKHDQKTRAMIKHAINNILYEQEINKYGTLSSDHYEISVVNEEENPLILNDD